MYADLPLNLITIEISPLLLASVISGLHRPAGFPAPCLAGVGSPLVLNAIRLVVTCTLRRSGGYAAGVVICMCACPAALLRPGARFLWVLLSPPAGQVGHRLS